MGGKGGAYTCGVDNRVHILYRFVEYAGLGEVPDEDEVKVVRILRPAA